jgi:hypothetical protein
MSLSSCLKDTLLHTFEPLGDGVASPHTRADLRYLQALKERHGIDYDSHASYRFTEKGHLSGRVAAPTALPPLPYLFSMPFRRLPRWLSNLVFTAVLAGGFGLPLADALVFHQVGAWQADVPMLGSPDQAVGHAATCALLGAPSASLHTPCATGRVLALEASAAPRGEPAVRILPRLPVADSRPRAPPVPPA